MEVTGTFRKKRYSLIKNKSARERKAPGLDSIYVELLKLIFIEILHNHICYKLKADMSERE